MQRLLFPVLARLAARNLEPEPMRAR
jgi:hypothetical protein